MTSSSTRMPIFAVAGYVLTFTAITVADTTARSVDQAVVAVTEHAQAILTIQLNDRALELVGWEVAPSRDAKAGGLNLESTLRIETMSGGPVAGTETQPTLTSRGALILAHDQRPFFIVDPMIRQAVDGRWILTTLVKASGTIVPVFELFELKEQKVESSNEIRLSAELLVSEPLADALGTPGAVGEWLGRIQIDASDKADAWPEMIADVLPIDFARSESMAGPDVIVGDLYDLDNYGSVGGISAFAVGTISCNAGGQDLNWHSSTNQHPVIAQNIYRLKSGRYEQIGQSWLKHGFAALTGNVCGFGCQDPGTSSLLGVGCSDPYSAGLNGAQYLLGPRSEVNAATGFYPYPWILNPPAAATIGRRIQVFDSDLESTTQTTTRYFVEGHYIAADDAAVGNGSNNASYREVGVEFNSSSNRWELSLMGSTQRKQAGVRAWNDSVVSDVMESDVNVPGDGLMILAADAYDVGGGVWEYEYALHNLNSDRSAGRFSVPFEAGTVITAIGFHDVEYHSGEVYDEFPWSYVALNGVLSWWTEDYASNPDANAVRWGTLYNFRFRANAPPQTTIATIGLFRPGTPTSMSVPTIGPAVGVLDCNGNGIEDILDIANGTSRDCNSNDVPDECESFPETPLIAVPFITGLTEPVFVGSPSGDPDRLFIVEQGGVIRIAQNGSLLATPFLDISGLVSIGGEQGLLSVAFHPGYATNGQFFVNYTNGAGNTVVARYNVSAGNANIADPGSAVILKTIVQDFPNHNGGQLQFGPDQKLYVGMGDGGDAFDPLNRAQDTGSLLGKMLRLDVDNPPDYIPSDNPYVGPSLPLDEIWSIGLRNPWRFSFDSWTGDMYIGDVGQLEFEEVDFQPANSVGGENYGWRCMEAASCTFLGGCACADPSWEVPIATYDHNSGDCSVTGGYVYRGCEILDLSGTYFHADYCSGRISSFRYVNGIVTDARDRTAELTVASGPIEEISSFGEDGNRELYVVSLTGTVYRIEANTAVCGNDIIEPGEECDDGNLIPGDGCDENCQIVTAGGNDSCASPEEVSEGTTPFDTTGATTDGPDEPATCNFFGFTQVGSDRWYCYTPTCTGTATVSLCGSSYDTKIAVYNGCSCPTGPSAIACNDDSCSTQSEIAFSVTACDPVMLRVGGYQSNQGTGTMTISCQPSGAITDCNTNGIDDSIDIQCGTSPDLNGNGIPDECESSGDFIVGGRLYDRWWAELIVPAPTLDHPLWAQRPDQTSNSATGSATWRCKECHGWDYKGVAGVYGTGSHRTGFPGIFGTTLSAVEIFELLKQPPIIPRGPGVANGHDYGSVLTDDEINDLVSFVLTGVIDDDLHIDPVSTEFQGDPVQGEINYTTGGSISCSLCHGADGASINFGTPADPEYVGTVATKNPWELMHKVRVGQPGTSMPSWHAGGGTADEVAGIGRHAQLNFPVDCIQDSQCDDGIACTTETCAGVGLCQNTPDDSLCADDQVFCNGPEACDAGLGCVSTGNPCGDPSACNETDDNCGCGPPLAVVAGSRYLAITHGATDPGSPAALVVTPDCGGGVAKYVGTPSGAENIATLVEDPADAARMTPAEWGTVYITGLDIVPDQAYIVQTDCGVAGLPSLTAPTPVTTALMGDVVGVFSAGAWTPPNGIVDVSDMTGVVDAFRGLPVAPAMVAADTFSCTPDQSITTLDFVGVLDGFRGLTYELSSLCPTPCP